MARNAVITVRTTPETKSAAEALFSTFGITLSDAINIFLNKAIMVDGLPFDMIATRYNHETEAAMLEAQLIANGTLPAKSYSSAAELFAELDAEEDGEC